MRFRMKITITYSILIVLLATFLGIVYNHYNIERYKEVEYNNLKLITEKTSRNFDEIVKPMQFISEYLLSDFDVLESLVTLATMDSNSALKASYVSEAESVILLKLNSYYISKNFHRVLVYNVFGNVVASNNYSSSNINTQLSVNTLSWLPKVVGEKGNPTLVGVHTDDWSIKDPSRVFSVVKEIQGMSMGFIEVQKEASELEDIFSSDRKDIDIVVVKSDGDFLYSSIDLTIKHEIFYRRVARDMPDGIEEFKNPVNNKIEVISSLFSEDTNVTVLLVEGEEAIIESLNFVTPATIIIVLIIFLASLTYIIIVSGLLTKPIRQLGRQMENTDISNLGDKIIYDKSNDEIEQLSKLYQKMLTRLNEAMIKERKTSVLHLKAQFDSLQSQVNPHFLYNVLNVIAYRGEMNDDEVICDMCQKLATMLRYSTDTKGENSIIIKEIDYLKDYFYLLKKRYEHRLMYTINIDERIDTQIIPKIVLQQVVENSVGHGFEDIDEVMEINISGWLKNGWWYISVRDNGQGFKKGAIEALNKKMDGIAESLKNEESNIELEIGGMGLVNTYARLSLLYEKDFVFIFSNCEKGAEVIIGAMMKKRGET